MRLGDREWRELIERHDGVVRVELERWRGRELDTAGDGFLAEFDAPRARFGARERSSGASTNSGSMCAQACTLEK